MKNKQIIALALAVLLIAGFLLVGKFYLSRQTESDLTSFDAGGFDYSSGLLPCAILDLTSTSTNVIRQDLGLVKTDSKATDCVDAAGQGGTVTYYNAGTVSTGPYAGSKRLVIFFGGLGPVGNMLYVAVALPDGKYLVDKSTLYDPLFKDYIDTRFFDLNKVKIVDHIEDVFPVSIKVGQFSLTKGLVFQSDELGIIAPLASTAGLVKVENKIDPKVTGLNWFASPVEYYPGKWNDKPEFPTLKIKSASFVLSDGGLSNYYDFYFQGKKDFSFKKAEIKLNTKVELFDSYTWGYPSGCGFRGPGTIVEGVTESDLKSIGQVNGIELFVLNASTSHPLYQIGYEPVGQSNIDQGMGVYRADESEPLKISLTDYAHKNPFLFFKDPVGRLGLISQNEYEGLPACGKPVLYFYPPKPTDVSVKFGVPMKLDVQIPNYQQGWKVTAYPDGRLVDLQSEATKCSAIDTEKLGSEYAKEACAKGEYPYLYWSGESLATPYPEINQGFVVAASDVESFLNEKLDYIGLTAQEKTDMMEYWLPKITAKQAPWYRISFLQSAVMDRFVPMQFEPKPDRFYRVFLDYLPLNTKPTVIIPEQSLEQINRSGFTVVEWGGLKR